MQRFLGRLFARRPGKSDRRPKQVPTYRPSLESLEERLVPVIGGNMFAAQVAQGGSFDGVVYLQDSGCTGSLLSTGRHVLTAAHCVDADGLNGTHGADRAQRVRFDVYHPAGRREVTMTVPANRITVHPQWRGFNSSGVWDGFLGNDLAIMTLTGPGSTGQVIAPWDAPRYQLFTGNAKGQPFTLVGYGETGTGATGNQFDEVQRVTVTAGPGGGTFRLGYIPLPPNPIPGAPSPIQPTVWSNPIAHNATAAQVADALDNFLWTTNAAGVNVSDVVVNNAGLPAGTWDVRFINGIGGRNVNQLQIQMVNGAGMSGSVFTRWDGGGTAVKRLGSNVYDQLRQGNVPNANGSQVAYDFDDGSSIHSSLGSSGADSGFAARGDSGGPGFMWSSTASRWEIASVVSGTPNPPGAPIDVTNYVFSDGPRRRDNSYGEINVDTRVASFAPWINQTIGGAYDLVLNMDLQPSSYDFGAPDVIDVSTSNGRFEIQVNGRVVHADYVSNLLSLRIYGSNDDETFKINNLPGGIFTQLFGLGGNDTFRIGSGTSSLSSLGHMGAGLFVDGGSGQDTLILDDSAADAALEDFKTGPTYTVSYFGVSRSHETQLGLHTVQFDFEHMDTVEIRGAANSKNKFLVEDVAPGTDLKLQGGMMDDIFTLGSKSATLSGIGYATIDGGDGFDRVFLDDRLNPAADFGPVHYALGPVYVQITESGFVSSTINFLLDGSGTPGHIESLELSTSNGVDFIDIYGTWSGLPVTINTGSGGDTATIRNWGSPWVVLGDLIIHGDSGYDTLIVNDTLSNTAQEYHLTDDSIGRAGVVPVHFADFQNVLLNAGNEADLFYVRATAQGSMTTINAGDGDDWFYVFDDAVRLESILGQLHLAGQGGNFNGVAIYDWGTEIGQTYIIDAGSVSRSNAAPISFSSIWLAYVYGTLGDDIFQMQHAAGGPALALYGWSGTDTLDYSHYETPVSVDLSSWAATDTYWAGGFTNVIGGWANDTIYGDDLDNVLTGGPGNDIIDGRGGNDTLLGGSVAYHLDLSLGLNGDGGVWNNWGGLDEKWFITNTGAWYYITPDGRFWLWDASSGPGNLRGTLVAMLSPDYHADPRLLYDAELQSSLVDNNVLDDAYNLDQSLGLNGDGGVWNNWGGLDEKWLISSAGTWYYITPDGRFWLWDSSTGPGNLQGTLVATLSAEYHIDTSLLYNAARQTVQADDNVLVGGLGNDTMVGGPGRNVFISGAGVDSAQGSRDEDLLIGGTTNYDENRAALDAILSEWSRRDLGYQDRIDHLMGFVAGGLNGAYLLDMITVQDDAVADVLAGMDGLDWSFAGIDDSHDAQVGEQIS